jgi:hypothetical protein
MKLLITHFSPPSYYLFTLGQNIVKPPTPCVVVMNGIELNGDYTYCKNISDT